MGINGFPSGPGGVGEQCDALITTTTTSTAAADGDGSALRNCPSRGQDWRGRLMDGYRKAKAGGEPGTPLTAPLIPYLHDITINIQHLKLASPTQHHRLSVMCCSLPITPSKTPRQDKTPNPTQRCKTPLPFLHLHTTPPRPQQETTPASLLGTWVGYQSPNKQQ